MNIRSKKPINLTKLLLYNIPDADIINKILYIQSHSDADKRCCAGFGQGTGPIHIDNLACSGSEYRLHNCQYGTDTSDESHDEDWSVYCNVG